MLHLEDMNTGEQTIRVRAVSDGCEGVVGVWHVTCDM